MCEISLFRFRPFPFQKKEARGRHVSSRLFFSSHVFSAWILPLRDETLGHLRECHVVELNRYRSREIALPPPSYGCKTARVAYVIGFLLRNLAECANVGVGIALICLTRRYVAQSDYVPIFISIVLKIYS